MWEDIRARIARRDPDVDILKTIFTHTVDMYGTFTSLHRLFINEVTSGVLAVIIDWVSWC
jgi:uncharacterized membrane protein